MSGLVVLPSNDVGLVVKVPAEEREESERKEHSDSDRCMSQMDLFTSAGEVLVWAGGVLGGSSLYAGNRSLSLGQGSVMLC